MHRHLEMTRRQPIAIRSPFRFCKLTTQQRGFEKRAYTVNPIPQLNFWRNPIPRLFYAQKVQSHSHFWFLFSSLSDPNPIFPVGKKYPNFTSHFISSGPWAHRTYAIVKKNNASSILSADQTIQNKSIVQQNLSSYSMNGELLYKIAGKLKQTDKDKDTVIYFFGSIFAVLVN